MSDHPPPYIPHPPGGPSAPGFPSALSSQPSAFTSSPYQTYTGGGDPSYYPGHQGAYLTQPGYQGYQSGPPGTSQPWNDPKTYGETPKHTVFVVEPNRGGAGGGGGGGTEQSYLAACSAALCCCCLWDMLTRSFC
ncbi:cysteine-rich and transmembrane domain-containing protein 1-like [Chelmon rostratus]|uniref:cysteine-rich and transmembrane domain-containing protein 1-like n=1 Tax=Chelmon rostratus TaxID=109905 RepID=UPI001BE64A01|nr:cysteine-rich and transmembrane domain-containing protein 1-like [Chelmon rostratus]